MSWLQKKIGGPRRRMKEAGLDIDLSYICQDRIIVMSFPASGCKTLWRNKWTNVKTFLERHHKGKYWIFNVSSAAYPKKRFENLVSNYIFQDHHAPPFHLLF